MRRPYRFLFAFLLPLLFLPFRVEGETVLLINLKDAEVEGKTFQNVQQFWYELGIVSDRQEVQLIQPPTGFFISLSESDQFDAAGKLCDNQNARAAVWLNMQKDRIGGFGMVAVTKIGKLGRTVELDTLTSSPQDTAIIVKELLEHSLTYADPVAALNDGWTPSDSPVPPPENRPEPRNPPFGSNPIIDGERPWSSPPKPRSARRRPKAYTVGILANFSQGIVSYTGSSTQVGGELFGTLLALKQLFFKLGFGFEAGPFLKPNGSLNTGRSLFPVFGVGVPFGFRKVELDLWADAAATYTKIYVELKGYEGEEINWWTFTARLGLGIVTPVTTRIGFILRAALSTGYPKLRVLEKDIDGDTVLKTPLLSFEAAAGMRILFFHRKRKGDA